MNRKLYGWIAAISLGLLVSGCGNNVSTVDSSGTNQLKSIAGISNVVWKYELKSPNDSVTTDKAVYVVDNNSLNAIDISSGKPLWKYETQGIPSTPSVTNDVISLQDKAGIHTLNAESGKVIWEHPHKVEASFNVRPAALTASSDQLFINEQLEDGNIALKALDAETGKEGWSYSKALLSLSTSPVIASDNVFVTSQGNLYILSVESGKELGVINNGAVISSLAAGNKLVVVSDLNGRITAYDLKSKKAKWSYTNDSFDIKNRPQAMVFANKVLLTEVKSGSVVMLDAEDGKELWNKKLGNPVFSTLYGGTITEPTIAENTVYLGVFEGQSEKLKSYPGYSSLMALNTDSGNELWRYQEKDLIFHSPTLIDNGMIVVTQNAIKAYQASENTQSASNEVKAEAASPSTPMSDALKVFEGQWSTPGSDELAISIAFTDDKSGVITYYNQGSETPIPFKFVKSSDTQLMTMLGSDEKPLILTLYDSGVLGYKTNEQRINLERNGEGQVINEGADLISGFNGKWCDSLEVLCFEIKLDGDSGGTLNYYQEREPYQESFRITYMDEYRIVIKINDSKETSLELSDDKNTLTYQSESLKDMMTRQK